jgi:hypothetical protein
MADPESYAGVSSRSSSGADAESKPGPYSGFCARSAWYSSRSSATGLSWRWRWPSTTWPSSISSKAREAFPWKIYFGNVQEVVEADQYPSQQRVWRAASSMARAGPSTWDADAASAGAVSDPSRPGHTRSQPDADAAGCTASVRAWPAAPGCLSYAAPSSSELPVPPAKYPRSKLCSARRPSWNGLWNGPRNGTRNGPWNGPRSSACGTSAANAGRE